LGEKNEVIVPFLFDGGDFAVVVGFLPLGVLAGDGAGRFFVDGVSSVVVFLAISSKKALTDLGFGSALIESLLQNFVELI